MMATEATPENFVDLPTTIPELEQTTSTTAQDATNESQVNGEAKTDELKQDTEPVEGDFSSAEVSLNGGSDTEATKAETSKRQTDDKGHARTASIVKPKSFKAVSVNKTFLAAKGATGTAPTKPGDKGVTGSATTLAASLTSSAPRPRLVAKLGSGLRDSVPRTSAASNGGTLGGAPDASVVWNKNRPAPPPEQKRITDEELKQQYGIHLATRLQSDDPGRQANWADIDDDDDDWAPESIEWTDGTKITLPTQAEEVQAVAKAAPASAGSDSVAASPKPRSPAPVATAVKLGGISGGSGKGLILKGATEKPTLVAKPPGPPTPVKSPWAPLPPVDKAAPISTELQQAQQHQQSRFLQRDPHGFDGMPPPPTKEIAADDFSRSWRDSNTQANTNRELYNSQSGRYEPVNDNRRGSSKNDTHSRQPALLQRPSQADQPEPSAAFQTHRATGADGSYGRRRTSSNVSGGSGPFVRRMSKGQEMPSPQELFGARRGSLVATSETPSSPRNYSPSGQPLSQRGHPQQWQRASPVISHASPASAHGQIIPPGAVQPSLPGAPLEDEVELQKKIMRESRELARKRRLEEEAREEAEKKERIRLKLEAMGPAPENKKKKETPKQEKSVNIQIQSREPPTASLPPPKPPVPEVAGEVKQYGLMKVHHPESVSLAAADQSGPSAGATRSVSQGNRQNGIQASNMQSEVVDTPASAQPPSGDSRLQTWQNSATSQSQDRFQTWASPAAPANQSRSVWGPPTNDRTLGNGTFNPELSLHGSQSSQMASNVGPGPIGPPNSGRINGYGRSREQYSQRPSPIGPPQRQQASARQDPARTQANLGWNNLPDKLAQEEAEQAKQDAAQRELQQPGGETSHTQPVFKDTWRQVTLGEDGTRSGIQTVSQVVNDVSPPNPAMSWNDYPNKTSQDEAIERAKFEQQRQMESGSSRKELAQPVYKDTWRQVQLENGVRSDILGSATVPGGNLPSASPAPRGSRFFPQSKDVRLEDPNVSFARPGSPSPPPPTMADHPAYDGDTSHPHVHLPHWPPVVKLPPPKVLAPIGPPKLAPSFASAASISPVAPSSHSYNSKYQDARLANDSPRPIMGPTGSGDWQDRINHLIGRKTSPPKSHALAVDSSSKNALELPSTQISATVSLPGSTTGHIADDDGAVDSKPMAEECFEEQEMGSLPRIRVPNKAPEAAWHLAPIPSTKYSRKFAMSNVTSSESVTFSLQITNSGNTIHIMIPGMDTEKCIVVPQKFEPRQKSNRGRGQSRGGPSRHTSSAHPRGGRARDASSGFQSPNTDAAPASPSPNSSSRGSGPRGRGGFGGSHWTRHTPTPTKNAINV